MTPTNPVQELEDRVAKLQRAVYYLIWKRTEIGRASCRERVYSSV